MCFSNEWCNDPKCGFIIFIFCHLNLSITLERWLYVAEISDKFLDDQMYFKRFLSFESLKLEYLTKIGVEKVDP